MSYRLLDAFKGLFDGQPYLHRRSNHGDLVALQLFEDLYEVRRSGKYADRVDTGLSVLNVRNLRRGIQARRGDGTFGGIVPNSESIRDDGFAIRRGQIATIEIGIEVKIMMKAMIKQIDRVINDLKGQSREFGLRNGSPIRVGIAGINHAAHCTTYEGERSFTTDGRKHKHPIDEAADAMERLRNGAAAAFDEFLILRFEATNEPPYRFSWIDERATELDYGAALARIAQSYEARF